MPLALSFQDFKAIIFETLGVDPDRLDKTVSFTKDLGIDSLSMVNFIIKLEKRFNIKYDINNLWTIDNVGEAYELLLASLNKSDPVS